MDAHDPRGMTGVGPGRRHRQAVDGLVTSGVAMTVLVGLFGLARPTTAASLLPTPSLPVEAPSLPVEVPSVRLVLPTVALPTPEPTPPPLPSVPLPTIAPTLTPLPSLPLPSIVPTPSLPLPSLPTPTLPTPSLPLPTGSPTPTPGGSGTPSATPSPGLATDATNTARPGTFLGGGPASVGSPALAGPDDVSPASGEIPSGNGSTAGPLESIVLPGLLIGVPAILVIGALVAQLAVGAAWLPVIRKWLRRQII